MLSTNFYSLGSYLLMLRTPHSILHILFCNVMLGFVSRSCTWHNQPPQFEKKIDHHWLGGWQYPWDPPTLLISFKKKKKKKRDEKSIAGPGICFKTLNLKTQICPSWHCTRPYTHTGLWIFFSTSLKFEPVRLCMLRGTIHCYVVVCF